MNVRKEGKPFSLHSSLSILLFFFFLSSSHSQQQNDRENLSAFSDISTIGENEEIRDFERASAKNMWHQYFAKFENESSRDGDNSKGNSSCKRDFSSSKKSSSIFSSLPWGYCFVQTNKPSLSLFSFQPAKSDILNWDEARDIPDSKDQEVKRERINQVFSQ